MPDPADILSRTLDGEAEGCGAAGMRHVASVILNRAAHPGWWGHDVASVCQAPWQFSCWNAGPDRDRIEALTPDNPWFAIAQSIAADALAGRMVDETNGADSYYARSMKAPPAWAAHATHVYSDGWHVFFRTAPALVPRNVSVRAAPAPTDSDADALMAQEQQQIDQENQT